MTTTAPTDYVDEITNAKRSSLLDGFNHVATVSKDLDRLIAFYGDIFEVPFVMAPDEGAPFRHGFFAFGSSNTASEILHVFEADETFTGELPDANAMFQRGRIDHLAINARSEQALATLRDRLVAAGVSDGLVTDFGATLSVHVIDPDGMRLEVCCTPTGEVFGPDDVIAPRH